MTIKETISLAEARKDIHYMQSEITDIKNAIQGLPDELIKKLDDRYALKTETVTKKGVKSLVVTTTSIGVLVTAILALLIK